MLHREGLRIAKPFTDILRRELSKQLSLPSCSHVVEQLRPRLDTGTSQKFQERRADILRRRTPPCDDRCTHRAIDARSCNVLQFQQERIQLFEDRAEPNSPVFKMFSLWCVDGQSTRGEVDVLPASLKSLRRCSQSGSPSLASLRRFKNCVTRTRLPPGCRTKAARLSNFPISIKQLVITNISQRTSPRIQLQPGLPGDLRDRLSRQTR